MMDIHWSRLVLQEYYMRKYRQDIHVYITTKATYPWRSTSRGAELFKYILFAGRPFSKGRNVKSNLDLVINIGTALSL